MMKFLEQRFGSGNIGEYPKVIQDVIQLHNYHCHMRYWQQPSPKTFFFIDEPDPDIEDTSIAQYTPGYDSAVARDLQNTELLSMLERTNKPPKPSISALTNDKKVITRKTSPLMIVWDDQYARELKECICSWFKQSELIGFNINAKKPIKYV